MRIFDEGYNDALGTTVQFGDPNHDVDLSLARGSAQGRNLWPGSLQQLS